MISLKTISRRIINLLLLYNEDMYLVSLKNFWKCFLSDNKTTNSVEGVDHRLLDFFNDNANARSDTTNKTFTREANGNNTGKYTLMKGLFSISLSFDIPSTY